MKAGKSLNPADNPKLLIPTILWFVSFLIAIVYEYSRKKKHKKQTVDAGAA